ncbi:MAG: tetratricopeptide repeat protein, partial [Acidobacteriaceae bacterium]
VDQHTFQPVHRTYTLRDEYRALKYGMGAQAFNKGEYAQALKLFQSALKLPASLGMDDFEQQSTPRIHYYIGRTLDAMGRQQEAKQAYEESIRGVDQLTGGGSETWTPENFFMVFSLQRLGRQQEAAALVKDFQTAAAARLDGEGGAALYRARAHYLVGLIELYKGNTDEAKKQMEQAVQIEPDDIGPRFELRGDAINPASAQGTH